LKIGALVKNQRAPHQDRHALGLALPAEYRTAQAALAAGY
jgi:hypothetical protein